MLCCFSNLRSFDLLCAEKFFLHNIVPYIYALTEVIKICQGQTKQETNYAASPQKQQTNKINNFKSLHKCRPHKITTNVQKFK